MSRQASFKVCFCFRRIFKLGVAEPPEDIKEERERDKSRQASFKVCFCFRRIFKLGVAEPPEDIKEVFNKYSENGGMSVDHFHRFLIEFQKEESMSKEEAQAIFNSLTHHYIFQRKILHLDAFFRYLFSDNNPPLSRPVHHDMNAPLAHYFLYTGHNSYLTGNQLSSDCSVDPIIKALNRGVRVIELDLWPNATQDNIDVCHGGTLTTPVDLDKCFWAIKENAFVASEYPVVITFEDHLTRALQAKVAQMVTKIFGTMLFYPKEDYLKEFPSPESLKKKIIISTKPPKEYLHAQSRSINEKGNSSRKEKDSEEGQPVGNEKIDVKIEIEPDHKVEPHEGEDNQDEDGENGVPQYRRLIAIHAGKQKGGLDNWLSIDPNKARRLSLSEQELEDAAQKHGKAIVRFTQRNLLRVYPKGIRVNSSNYDPLVGWMHGAQMVAFNMQGYGKHLWTMHGMFRANGGCGYVKKPDFLLNESEVFDPSVIFPVKTTLRVKVFMGDGWHSDFHTTHFDRFSPPDFFTKIGIAGVPEDTSTMKKTKPIEDEWTPTWNKEFQFPLTVPELALLRIEVGEFDTTGKHDFGGQTCLPVSELRSGVRAIPLHNRKGVAYRSVKLLMQFQFD